MKESYSERRSEPPDPESCVGGRKGAGEALTGAHAGQVLSREISRSGVPTPLSEAEGNTGGGAIASRPSDPAQSETPCMHGNSLHENREIPRSPVARWCGGPVGEGHEP